MVVTTKARADKAINSLKGILLGIKSDDVLTKLEINELKRWAIIHRQLISRNPFKEFMSLIDATISKDIPTDETIEDLFWLCQKYESDNYYYNVVTSDLQTLQGICHGVLSDGSINDKEVLALEKWLGQNNHLSTYYPYDEIRSLILSILSDGKIDEDEKLILKAYLSQFVKIEDKTIAKQIDDETIDIHISGHCTSDPNIKFIGKTFCFTGILKSGTRSEIQKLIEDLGGIPTNSLNRKTDYLIVGDNGNPAWTFACYGRKVEKALALRKKGYTISLVHEFDFMDATQDLN